MLNLALESKDKVAANRVNLEKHAGKILVINNHLYKYGYFQ